MTIRMHLPLAEDSGSTVSDFSGNETDITLLGAPGPSGTGTVSGPFGNSAYQFDGSDDGLQTSSIVNDNQNDFTISVWVKVADSTSSRPIFTSDPGSGDNDLLIFFRSDGTYAFYSFNGSIIAGFNGGGKPYTTGEWINVVATYSTTEGYKLYENGILMDSDSRTSLITGSENDNYFARPNSSQYADIEAADLRHYERTLSPQEVQALYQAGERSEAVFAVTDSTAAAQSVSGGGGGGGGSTGGGGGGTTY